MTEIYSTPGGAYTLNLHIQRIWSEVLLNQISKNNEDTFENYSEKYKKVEHFYQKETVNLNFLLFLHKKYLNNNIMYANKVI